MTAVYLQLAAYACATTFSPGPNNILLFSSTSRYGIRKCWPLIFGIWAGLITVMLLCGFGCAWLGELVPQIVPVAKYVGAAYILYLAYRTLMRSPGAKKEDGPSGKPLSYVNGGGCNPSYQRGASVRGLQKRFPHLQLLNFEPTDVYRAVLIVCGCSARCAGQADLPVDIPRLVMAAQEDIERAAEFLEKLSKEQ